MTLSEVLTGVRAALLPVAPTYIRDSIPLHPETKLPVLPDRCIIIDLIIDNKVRDFTDVYASVLVQVGCWSPSVAQSLDDLEAARAALEAAEWEMVRINGTQTDADGSRGVTADFQNIY